MFKLPFLFLTRFKIDVRASTEVTSINRSKKTVSAINGTTGEEYTELYDKLVLSPGAKPIRPASPGIQYEGIFTVRSVTERGDLNDL